MAAAAVAVTSVGSRPRKVTAPAASSTALAHPVSPAVGSLERLGLLEDRLYTKNCVKLGSGSLGVVILAQDLRSSRKLAVKVISLKLARDAGGNEARTWQEAQVMREIDHPNIVRLVDVLACWNRVPYVKSEPPYLCIAMEYVADSEPLSNEIRRSGPSPALATKVVPQLADALTLLHQRGLVHRDVWSENVLVNDRGRAVLVDLGCAEYVRSGPAVNSKLNIPYMSPEAAQGLPQSPGEDCWALGLLITEIVTGRFIADRIGRSDVPIHFNRPLLAEALREAVAQGGPLLGRLCTQLLETQASLRISMAEVVAQCGGQASAAPSVASYVPPANSGLHVTPVDVEHVSRGSSFPVTGGATAVATAPLGSSSLSKCGGATKITPNGSGISHLVPGQTVLYHPRSHSGVCSATVVGRAAQGQGWQIRLEGGALKEVEDAEAWRLAPAPAGHAAAPTAVPVQAVEPPPGSPRRRRQAAAHPQAVATAAAAPSGTGGTVSVPPPVGVRDRAVSATASLPVGSIAAPHERPPVCATTSLPAGSLQPRSPTVVSSTVSLPSSGTAAGSSRATGGAAAPTPVPTRAATTTAAPGPVRSSGQSAVATAASSSLSFTPGVRSAVGEATAKGRHLPALAPGQRVSYTARSNGVRYPGSLVGRLTGRGGWRVVLDCGDTKEVEDAEAWRLAPAAL